MHKNISSALIISTYNWPQALRLCFLSVMEQVVMPDEIIIADDGSGMETRKLIEEYKNNFPVPLKHAWHKDDGFRKTLILNKAVKLSSFDYIIQIDGDVILNKFFIKDHLASAEGKAFIRGTRALLTAEKSAQVIRTRNSSLSAFDKGIIHRYNAFRCFFLRKIASRKELSSKSVRGSNLSFWKSDFIKVNGYNNELTGWGHEDEELAARFVNNGIKKKIIKLCAVQYHLFHPQQSRENEQSQNNEVRHTVNEKIKTCVNGYNVIST